MELLEAIEGRRSVRAFTNDPVPDHDIVAMIRAASLAPSAGNAQMWRFIAIKNRAVLSEMKEDLLATLSEMLTWPESEPHVARIRSSMANGGLFAEAPVVVAVLQEPYRNPYDTELFPARGMSWEEIYRMRGDPGRQSMGAAVQNLILRAYSLGYGACWMTNPLLASSNLERILKVEEPWRLIALVLVGVPQSMPAAKPRKPVEQILTIID